MILLYRLDSKPIISLFLRWGNKRLPSHQTHISLSSCNCWRAQKRDHVLEAGNWGSSSDSPSFSMWMWVNEASDSFRSSEKQWRWSPGLGKYTEMNHFHWCCWYCCYFVSIRLIFSSSAKAPQRSIEVHGEGPSLLSHSGTLFLWCVLDQKFVFSGTWWEGFN